MEKLESRNNKTWDTNHLKIIDAYTTFVEANNKAPKVTELAEICQLTRPIIYKHLKHMQLNEISNKYKIRAMSILEGVAKKAEEGDVAAAKLMLQLAFGWNEKKIMDVQTTNRSIKVVFTNPSNEDLKKITETNTEEINYEEVNDSDDS